MIYAFRLRRSRLVDIHLKWPLTVTTNLKKVSIFSILSDLSDLDVVWFQSGRAAGLILGLRDDSTCGLWSDLLKGIRSDQTRPTSPSLLSDWWLCYRSKSWGGILWIPQDKKTSRAMSVGKELVQFLQRLASEKVSNKTSKRQNVPLI